MLNANILVVVVEKTWKMKEAQIFVNVIVLIRGYMVLLAINVSMASMEVVWCGDIVLIHVLLAMLGNI